MDILNHNSSGQIQIAKSLRKLRLFDRDYFKVDAWSIDTIWIKQDHISRPLLTRVQLKDALY